MSASSGSSSGTAASSSAAAPAPAAAGAPAAPSTSKRVTLLRKVYLRALANWEVLLTAPVADEDAFRAAFKGTLARHPETLACARTGGMLAAVMRKELPSLARDAPEAIDALIKDATAGFLRATAAEFDEFVRETGLEEKLAELDVREAQLKAARADAASELPAPLALQPEDEARSIAVEAMLAHEAELLKELERMRAENEALESSVGELSARSKAVGAASEARMAQLRVAADAARACLDSDAAAAGGSQ